MPISVTLAVPMSQNVTLSSCTRCCSQASCLCLTLCSLPVPSLLSTFFFYSLGPLNLLGEKLKTCQPNFILVSPPACLLESSFSPIGKGYQVNVKKRAHKRESIIKPKSINIYAILKDSNMPNSSLSLGRKYTWWWIFLGVDNKILGIGW